MLRRGFADAGAVFIVVQKNDGETILFGPAPQTSYGGEEDADRRFVEILRAADEGQISARLERETRFDTDAWIVELEIGRKDPGSYFAIV